MRNNISRAHTLLSEALRNLNHNRTLSIGQGSAYAGVCSTESLSADVKNKSNMAVELFDEQIAKTASQYFGFNRLDLNENINLMIDAVGSMKSFFSEVKQPIVDEVKWSDDAAALAKLRQPVSRAYLQIFSDDAGNAVVSDSDFWKALDRKNVRFNINQSIDFKNISTVFIVKSGMDRLVSLANLIIAIKQGVIDQSTSCETLLTRVVDAVASNQTLSPSEKIQFDKVKSTVLGVTLEAVLPTIINQAWHKVNLNTTIGGMATDAEYLLRDAIEECTASNTKDPAAFDNLCNTVADDKFNLTMTGIRREISNTVDIIKTASNRLTEVVTRITELPDQSSGGYNYIVDDLSILAGIYSATLNTMLNFITVVDRELIQATQSAQTLAKKIQVLEHCVSQYEIQRNIK